MLGVVVEVGKLRVVLELCQEEGEERGMVMDQEVEVEAGEWGSVVG